MFLSNFDLITPWRDLYRLRDEMDKVFSDYRGRTSTEYPSVNIWTGLDGALLTAELPGINAEDIELSISGDTLTLKGERNPEELKEDECYHRQERPYGKFVRSINCPLSQTIVKLKLNAKMVF